MMWFWGGVRDWAWAWSTRHINNALVAGGCLGGAAGRCTSGDCLAPSSGTAVDVNTLVLRHHRRHPPQRRERVDEKKSFVAQRSRAYIAPTRAHKHTLPHTRRYGVYGVYGVRATNLRAGAESQQIVATRPLYCLQYPASTKSSAKD